MKSPSNPEQLVQKLFLQNAAPLRGFIFGLLPDRAAAEDVFQEVFVTVTRRAADFDSSREFLPWVRGISRHKVLEHFRVAGLRPQLFDEGLVEVMASAAEGTQDLWEARRVALANCIEQLAPRARQILELRYAEQPLSPASIAERLAWTVNAVNVALSRARKFLQDCTRLNLRLGGAT